MIYVLFKGISFVGIAPPGLSPFTGTPELRKFAGIEYDRVESSWDWTSYEQVRGLAMYITAITGRPHIGIDNGPGHSPQFDVIQAPQIGDKVSYGFNGDYYPDGEIVKISKTYQITTSTGNTYRRKGLRGSWLKPGGTWGLVGGHISEQNPHF